MMTPYCRLFCRSNNQDLVLAGCSATVNIVDVHASVLLCQRFHNPFSNAVSATYTFSTIAAAAISGFEMVREDGTKVEGIVKEKEEARKEYNTAVSQGLTASLGEEQTKDVFSVSVGNILASEVVTINIRFTQPLIDDEKRDQVRFTFPREYTQRYGQAPTFNAAVASTAHQPFRMNVIIQQAGFIKSVSCPSGHPITFELGPPEGYDAEDAYHFAHVTLKDTSGYLTQDVLLVVSAANLDVPRCFFEPHPSPNHLTTAVGLTFVPRFTLPDVDGGMEYVFLVDRSGSMQGGRIQLVREALVVLLRGLPTKNTTFNVVSFGDRATQLWTRSRLYNQASLDEATNHVDSMAANYGGTEIAKALQTVFSSLEKPLQKPVSVFVLTDGGAWDIANCVQNTERALSELPGSASFIRVFTVGIGSGVSTDTCESIARAGDGMAVYVSEGESMTGKCARLVRAARTPPVSDLLVLWPGRDGEETEDGFEMVVVETEAAERAPSSVNLFQEDDKMDVDVGPLSKSAAKLPPTPAVQQAPIALANLFPGTRTQIYAIIDDSVLKKDATFPSTIKVRGKVRTTGTAVELDVPVKKLIQTSPTPILHTLAAKALITDREDGRKLPPALAARVTKNPEIRDAYIEKDIIRLGTTYGLTSRYTSFVAVDRAHDDQNLGLAVSNLGDVLVQGFAALSYSAMPFGSAASSSATTGQTTNIFGQSQQPASHLFGQARPAMSPPPAMWSPLAISPPPPPPAQPTGLFGSTNPAQQTNLFGRLFHPTATSDSCIAGNNASTNPLFGKPQGTIFGAQPQQASFPPPPQARPQNQQKLAFAFGDPLVPVYAAHGKKATAWPTAQQEQVKVVKVGIQLCWPLLSLEKEMDEGERLASIARFQQFDGGFTMRQALLDLLKTSPRSVSKVIEKLRERDGDEDFWATILAWMWLKAHGGDAALDMIEKAEEWLHSKTEKDLKAMADGVMSLVTFV